ncbi:ATP-binding protein [Vitiosangium sp. GDMCC 1.1324]|uniref:PAS domain-containing sensor histidine kinase n=1 Tax=Vitiosangium sp. (strain GDMCC 1.1324) TaxID=2138576 RepID=UPI000D35A8A7|nr:ATP-binding protein [Vitiosangium sp. GDMCC 1.1324]PTL84785.1 PAS domain-containing sensor histidine kinase [Vitiosangium sp. GDMCC 1.1324]
MVSSRSGDEASSTAAAGETTLEYLLQVVARLAANEPHVRCQVGEGPLAPMAAALNQLALQLESHRTVDRETFGIQALVEQSPSMMLACDVDAKVRFFNYTTPGYSPAEVVGKSVYDWVLPEELERVRGYIRKVLENGETVSFDAPSATATGPAWYMVQVGPIKDRGEVIGFTMIMTDISALKQTQARLEQSNRELESFASVASHDLQEPLRKIQTFGARLKTVASATMGAEGLGYLERMLQAATRMRSLIDDLLSFSRVTSMAQPFVPVDLARVAREVKEDLETAIERQGATVTLGELPTLDADPTQMRQLFQNLMSNALKFRRDDVAPVISVEASVDAATRWCELRVADNGIGFEEKYLDRIFDVFQRLHGRGKYEGTGIGLAICRKIVERHGGTIGARSSPGNGATFIIRLPLVQSRSR